MPDIDKFQFRGPKDGWIYLDNPSPMALVSTREWFEKVIGKENCAYYDLGGFFGGFTNAFKFKESCIDLVREKIFPELVKDGEYYRRKETMAEANLI